MDLSKVMDLFSKNYLESYYGKDYEEDLQKEMDLPEDLPASESPLAKRLEEHTEESKDIFNLSFPSVLGDGLGSVTNNPRFSRRCNPCDTEFEIEVCDSLVDILGLDKGFKYTYNGLGIINACETDGLLTLLITSQYQKKHFLKDESITSDKFIVYASERVDIHPIQRIVQMRDQTLRVFSSAEQLEDLISQDKADNLYPTIVIHDVTICEEEKYSEQISSIQKLWHFSESCEKYQEKGETFVGNEDTIWYHVNLGVNGWKAIAKEYKFMTKFQSDSVIVEAAKYLGTSYESSLMWVKNKDRVEEGLHLEVNSEK